MTLASQLKQKSQSINLDRAKSAARAKQAERNKAARIAEVLAAKKEREKEKQKKRLDEQKRLLKWLTPGLLAAWNQSDYIQYRPTSDEERSTAKKYLGYTACHDHIVRLNKGLNTLEIDIKVLQNRVANLRLYADTSFPSLVFDVDRLLSSYEKQTHLFDGVWRSNFRRESTQFEKSALAGYALRTKEAGSRAKNNTAKVKAQIAQIYEDPDILQVSKLADALRPRIDTFHSQYHSLMSSPASFFQVNRGGSEFEGVNYVELTTQREYQLAVARHVLREMNIHCFISSPDVTGKFMSAFRIASGEAMFDALLEHITDPDLISKLVRYSRIISENPESRRSSQQSSIEGQKIADIVDSIFISSGRVCEALKELNTDELMVVHGHVSHNPSVKIDELFETSLSADVDRLAYDIQWLRSIPGQKFKKEFTRYLNELAGDGKYSAKIKVFSENEELLIELPSGKEISCDMDWYSFERLMNLLELQITETTSSGIVKLKWG